MVKTVLGTTKAHLQKLQQLYLAGEQFVLNQLLQTTELSGDDRAHIHETAVDLGESAREGAQRGQLIDTFLQEYGLSTEEGVTLMRLAESLIRTPDTATAHILMRDKVGSGNWSRHAAQSNSKIVNLSTRGLQLSTAWISATGGARAKNLLARMGDSVLYAAVSQAVALMGTHFVLGNTIAQAIDSSKEQEGEGYAFSYDMLGEAAHTNEDAAKYFEAYKQAVNKLAEGAGAYQNFADAPGISVKLSALHPRYEYVQRHICVPDLVARVKELALVAKQSGMSLTIDAEEADRLEVSLEIIEQLLADPDLAGWGGLGIVVQAYQKRATAVVRLLTDMATTARRPIMVRLVKGAYWDSEIKRAQELGLASYPVFTRKENTDTSYLACARLLFKAGDIIFPQFATHNAHTAAVIMHMAGDSKRYEFQRLHGMGKSLHENLIDKAGVRSRIYAPVGQHKDLLPYLVRRLLENGANSSFVNQLIDPAIEIDEIVRDPMAQVEENSSAQNPAIVTPTDLFSGERRSAKGLDLTHSLEVAEVSDILQAVKPFKAASIVCGVDVSGTEKQVSCPTDGSFVGTVQYGTEAAIDEAISAAAVSGWLTDSTATERAACMNKAADLLEEQAAVFIQLCVKEAGKSLRDTIAELREAIDFCRYYAGEAISDRMADRTPLGVVACISPWNFPLAIFLGQIAAALSAGNTVVVKPAAQTQLIAYEAVRLMHRAGVPKDALHLILGEGRILGAHLVAAQGIAGVCFTGSTATAKHIAASLADTGKALVPLIAETGGINVMIIDSTALLEQAVTDVVAAAFQSAGQRCSACRIVCVQEDVADDFEVMLKGSMDLLTLGDPSDLSTDVGPVIDADARQGLQLYIAQMRGEFSVLSETKLPANLPAGHFVAPIAFSVPNVSAVKHEVFGPVLHIIRFKAGQLHALLAEINGTGYGLTMGLHTRIDDRVEQVKALATVGNLYVNRNQIGAVVGTQPFGGEGLSGTGPKAGGPHYLRRLSKPADRITGTGAAIASAQKPFISEAGASAENWQVRRAQQAFLVSKALDRAAILHRATEFLSQSTDVDALFAQDCAATVETIYTVPHILPGPTGETNTLSLHARGVLLCIGGDAKTVLNQQILRALAAGNSVIAISQASEKAAANDLFHALNKAGLPKALLTFADAGDINALLSAAIDGVVCDGAQREAVAHALYKRDGAIIPLLSVHDDAERFCVERTVSIDTTAAGGNASLLAI